MDKKFTLLTTGILILFIGFVVIFLNKAIANNESMEGMPGMSENDMEGMKDQEVHDLSQSDLLKDLNNPDVTIVDIRELNLYQKSHIPNSINIPFGDFQSRFQELDSNKNIILVCHVGSMGESSGQFLLQQGFQHVSNLSDGMAEWSGSLEN
jgi:rhodanese-related sulfurtransferase